MLDTDGSFSRRRSEGISDYSVLRVEFKKNKAFVTLFLDPWKSFTLQSWMKLLLYLEGLYKAERNGLKQMLVAWKFYGGSFNIYIYIYIYIYIQLWPIQTEEDYMEIPSRWTVMQSRSCVSLDYRFTVEACIYLTLILLTWRKWWAPNNASK